MFALVALLYHILTVYGPLIFHFKLPVQDLISTNFLHVLIYFYCGLFIIS
jgi:hypothetical protein